MSLPVDHSAGHKPAKAGDHNRWEVTIYHNRCGRAVTMDYGVSWSCAGPCPERWKRNVMNAFTDDQMACRWTARPTRWCG